MRAMLIIDMQVGLFEGIPPCHDADGVVRRINEIAWNMRATGGIVIFIQHEDNDNFRRGTTGWEILPSLERMDKDQLDCRMGSDRRNQQNYKERH